MVSHDHGRVNRRNILKSSGVAAAVGLAGCGGGGDGGDGGTPTPGDGGDTGGDTGGDGGTPTEQGPPSEVQPYLESALVPDYYPDGYWRIVQGAMEEDNPTLYTAFFGSMIEKVLEGYYELVDFHEYNITTLGTAEVFSRFTTEASRGQINPDVIFTYDPIAMRQLYTAGLLENRWGPNWNQASDAWPARTKSEVEGMFQAFHSWSTHVFNPQLYEEAGIQKPPKSHDIGWYTDHIEDNPDFYNENTAQYDGITSTSGWQQMDFYATDKGEDWMKQQYSEMATTNPRSFWSTSTMGGWVANGEVAYGMGLAQWIVAQFVAPEFDIAYSGAPLWWSDFVMTNLQWPNYQVVKNADNPNSAKLFADWITSPHGQAHTARSWYLSPGRSDIPNDELRKDPVWGISTNATQVKEELPHLDSIFMDFNKRSVRSDKKAKYKDMWYNLFA